MMAVAEKNMEQDGFFEGVYDYNPENWKTDDRIENYIHWMGRFDIRHAQPVIFGFREEVNPHLRRLSLPYRQQNNLVQIGDQYWHNRAAHDSVPDAYTVLFARTGRFGEADQTRKLYVSILRDSVATQLIEQTEITRNTDTVKKWQKIAQTGRSIGNAVLAMSTETESYSRVIRGTSGRKFGALRPVNDNKLAKHVFETVLYWEA